MVSTDLKYLEDAMNKAEDEWHKADNAYETALKNPASCNLNELNFARKEAADAWAKADTKYEKAKRLQCRRV